MQNHVSTAGRVVDDLAEAGVQRTEIGPHHLVDLYASLKRVKDCANFSAYRQLLPVEGNLSPWGDEVVAVIIETRPVPQLEYVIKNMSERSGLRVHVFHGADNKCILQSRHLASMRASGKLRQTELSTDTLNANEYNALVLSRGFWKHLSGRRKILFFQTDALCCANADYDLSDFLSYDYIGGSWPTDRPIGIRIHGGVGGFSLRDWGRCVEALERFPPEFWLGGEDGYFAFHLDLMGCRVADEQAMAKFGTQSFFHYRSFGAHRVQSLSAEDHSRFLEYCPEIVNVLKWQRS